MAEKFPESYKDSAYDNLDAQTTERLGLPEGLLSSIRTKGERSNASQVSSASAVTPYQFIPATRKAILDKYGIDVTLNPKNASLGAGYLLKESLDRNKGSIPDAVGEYTAGTDRKAWGPITRAYIARVTGDQPEATQSGSRSLRAELDASQPQKFGVTQAYQAYKSGQMPPDVAQEFEADVNAGKILLPRGAVLKNQPAPAQVQQVSQTQPQQVPVGKPVQIPPEIAQAYANGSMPADVRAEMEADIRDGRAQLPPLPFAEDIKRGLGLGTRNLIEGAAENIVAPFYNPIAATINAATGSQIPTAETHGANIANALGLPTAQDPGERLLAGVQRMAVGAALPVGGGEAVAQNAVSPVARAVGRELAASPVTQAVSAGAAGGASEAAKQAGYEGVGQTIAGIGGGLAGVGGAAAASRAIPAVERAVGAAATAVGEKASAAGNAAKRAVGMTDETAAAGRNVGAAETEASAMRRANAQDLPVPVDLTKGQATREFGQQRFERETAKNAEIGAPIRERFAQQNEQLQQNLDAFIDSTGAQAGDLRTTGIAVDKAVRDAAAKAKTEIRVAYKNAEKAGETKAPVNTSAVTDVINSSSSAESLAPILGATKKEIQRLGGAIDDNGNLVARDMTLGDMETLRKFVNKNAGIDPTNIKYAADLKRAIDASTEGVGGELYNRARRLRAKFAKEYENRAVISDLLKTKRGSDDRKVAFEDVVNRIVNNGSLDDVRFARKILQTGSEDGRQAWREIQGATLQNIKEQATKNVARDENGNAILSPAQLDRAIKALERDGKLDFIFGKRGAEQLRTINDVAKDVLVAPPNAVNTSNTASVLLGAIDLALSAGTGLPAPIATSIRAISKNIKDRKLRARVRQALEQPNQKPERF